jgi:hypothetical protein
MLVTSSRPEGSSLLSRKDIAADLDIPLSWVDSLIWECEQARGSRLPATRPGMHRRFFSEVLPELRAFQQRTPRWWPRKATLTARDLAKHLDLPYHDLRRRIRRWDEEHSTRLPSEGEGHKRRYLPEAVGLLKSLLDQADAQPTGPATVIQS